MNLIRSFLIFFILSFSAGVYAADSSNITPPTVNAQTEIIGTVMHMVAVGYTWSQAFTGCSSQGVLTQGMSRFNMDYPYSRFPTAGLVVYYCQEKFWPSDPPNQYYQELQTKQWVPATPSNPYCKKGTLTEVCSMKNLKPPVIGWNAAYLPVVSATDSNYYWPEGYSYNYLSLGTGNPPSGYTTVMSSLAAPDQTEISVFYYLPSTWPPSESDAYPNNWFGNYLWLKIDVGMKARRTSQPTPLYEYQCHSNSYLLNYDTLGKVCTVICNPRASWVGPGGGPGNKPDIQMLGTIVCGQEQALKAY